MVSKTEMNYLVALNAASQGSTMSLLQRNGNHLDPKPLEKLEKFITGGASNHAAIQGAVFSQILGKFLVYNENSLRIADLAGKTDNLYPQELNNGESLANVNRGKKQVYLYKNMVYFMTSSPPGFTGIDLETLVPLDEIYPLESFDSALEFTFLGKDQHYQQMKFSYHFNSDTISNPKFFYCTRNLKVTEYDINADGKRCRKGESYFLPSQYEWNPSSFAVHPVYLAWSEMGPKTSRRICVVKRRDIKSVFTTELTAEGNGIQELVFVDGKHHTFVFAIGAFSYLYSFSINKGSIQQVSQPFKVGNYQILGSQFYRRQDKWVFLIFGDYIFTEVFLKI